MQRIPAFAFVVFLLMQPVAARAAVLNADGTQALKEAVGESLAWYNGIAEATGQGIRTDGAVEITPREKHYEVRIPGVSVSSAGGFALDVGTVVINAVPGEKAGEWILSMALPPQMTIQDATHAPIADLVLGRQKFSAAWTPALNVMSRTDAEYHDIALKPRGNMPVSLAIGRLRSTSDMTANADGTWTGPNFFEIDKARLRLSGKTDVTLAADRIVSRGMYDKTTLGDMKQVRKDIQALIDSGKDKVPQAQIRADIVSLVNKSATLPDNFSSALRLAGISADIRQEDAAAGTASPAPFHLEIAAVSGDADMKGLKQDKGGMSAKAHMEGLKMTGVPQPLEDIVPHTMNASARLDSLPMQELAKVFFAVVGAAQQGKEIAEQQKSRQEAQDAVARLPQLLAGAGAAFSVTDTYVKASGVNAALEGSLSANAASPIVAVGSMTLSVGGLDELVEKNKAGNPKYAQTMLPFQVMGRLEKGPDGKSLRQYKFDMMPDGKILLNGLDVSLAKGMLSGMASPALLQPAPVAPTP